MVIALSLLLSVRAVNMECNQPDPCPGCGNCLLCDGQCTCQKEKTVNEIRIDLDPGMDKETLSRIWDSMEMYLADDEPYVIFSMSPGTYRLPDNWRLDGNQSPITFGVGGKGRELMFCRRSVNGELLVETRFIGMSYTWRPLFP